MSACSLALSSSHFAYLPVEKLGLFNTNKLTIQWRTLVSADRVALKGEYDLVLEVPLACAIEAKDIILESGLICLQWLTGRLITLETQSQMQPWSQTVKVTMVQVNA